ncbi:MAG: translation initiation factor IF-2 [Coriobacteriales bacterium]|jgi:translation initiation factor IF-2|nr:translation initiation factor IF-2 [Coriobacteriales bacterium]
MAVTRVHELAKEFGMSSKELLVHLEEMKIPAKGHSSTLVDAYVDKVRKHLGPEIAEKQAEAEEARKAEAAAKAAAERKRREEEAAAKAAAAEKERAQRKTQLNQEQGTATGAASVEGAAEAFAGISVADKEQRAEEAVAAAPAGDNADDTIEAAVVSASPASEAEVPKAPEIQALSPLSEASDEVSAEASEVSGEASSEDEGSEEASGSEEQQSGAEAAVRAASTDKAPATASKADQAAAPATEQKKTADRAATIKKAPSAFSGLLSRIAAEQSRIDAEKASLKEERKAKATAGGKAGRATAGEAAAAGKPGKTRAKGSMQAEGSSASADDQAREQPLQQKAAKGDIGMPVEPESEGRGSRKGKGRKGRDTGEHEPGEGAGRSRKAKEVRKQFEVPTTDIYEDDDASEDARYRQMAIAAEILQREKVLAEARAAVKAADDEGGGRRKKRKEKREAEAKERAELVAIERGLDPVLVLDSSVAEIPTGASVQEFSDILGVASNDVVKRLFLLGSPLTVTQTMGDELIELIADDLERKIRIVSPEEEYVVQISDAPDKLLPRPPVVTVMGHVDHGKTSLLDAIRETEVIASEAGGITQHIGASVVHSKGRQITFIDTPGHEAFTAMRARGARITDVVVLVVAADDGVMPQTIEAINHAEAAGVPLVVAINKIDKPGATPERARQELSEHGIVPEEWGGQNMFVEVSAKKRINIDELLEAIILQADVLELRANPNALASGFVIEAKLDRGRGPVATVLVQRGTIQVGDAIVMGTSYGRVRALINPVGENVAEARPSDPVEIIGLNSVPDAGDDFRVFAEERSARNLAEDRSLRRRMAEQQNKQRITLENLFSHIEQDKLSELNLIVKADVQGSIEALGDALAKMDQSEVRINIIHSAVGGVTETDVILAAASNAVIIGFNVRPTAKARQMAVREEVEIKTYKIIYQAIEDINAARVGLLAPEIVEEDTGLAEVRETFKVPKLGTIAGCLVEEGEIGRDDRIRIIRDSLIIHEGTIASLRRFKDDVKSVKAGYECGIGIEGYQDIKPGDTLETFKITEVVREA